MTTTIPVPVYEFGPNGEQVPVGTVDVVLDGDAEETYLADKAIRAAFTTLRGWADDAETAHTNWPGMTPAQKDAAIRETIRRVGVFMDRFADTLVLEQRKGGT